MAEFDPGEWERIWAHFEAEAESFGLPERRQASVVLGSWNIRKLGRRDGRSRGAWRFLTETARRFDLLAIQEVQDDLAGLRHIRAGLGESYGMVASDVTGAYPGAGAPERLAFVFCWQRVERTEIASDITYDRSAIIEALYDSRVDFWKSFDRFTERFLRWEVDAEQRRREGRKPKRKPNVRLPRFVSFIRQPLCVSFRIPGLGGMRPYEFLAVNAHLLYGRYKSERRMEFEALMAWLLDRAKNRERMYHENILLLGDLNLDFERSDRRRDDLEEVLKRLNKDELADPDQAELNFPFFDPHPGAEGVFRTNARLDQTYDQIALASHDPRLPGPGENTNAGATADGFDYGVFNFVELFCQALHGRPVGELSQQVRQDFYRKFEFDVSDHMPLWLRLPLP